MLLPVLMLPYADAAILFSIYAAATLCCYAYVIIPALMALRRDAHAARTAYASYALLVILIYAMLLLPACCAEMLMLRAAAAVIMPHAILFHAYVIAFIARHVAGVLSSSPAR